MKRLKNDEGWMFLAFLMGPIGIACVIGGVLLLVIAVML